MCALLFKMTDDPYGENLIMLLHFPATNWYFGNKWKQTKARDSFSHYLGLLMLSGISEAIWCFHIIPKVLKRASMWSLTHLLVRK